MSEYFLTQQAFAEERFQVGYTAVYDIESLILACNLFGHGFDFRFNTGPLLLQGCELIAIGFFESQKNVVLGRINALEISVASVETDKQGHHKIIAFIPLGFKARFTHEQTYLIRLELAHAPHCCYEV